MTLFNHPEWLNLNQPPAELFELYGEKDYYWYLRSEAFGQAFLRPLAKGLDNFLTILDVGCGEAQLQPHIEAEGGTCRGYLGFDGSMNAVRRGYEQGRQITYGRIEAPPALVRAWNFDVVIFGGLLSVLLKPEYRLEMVLTYCKALSIRHVAIYDLATLDLEFMNKDFELLCFREATADMPELQEIKCTRLTALYSLR